ncbi:MAG: hypothetical protein LLG04_13850 [Parachlamydia sp.]|nr:hypothetical protein [Parachlamydia sp.]
MDRVGFVGQKYEGDVADLVSDSLHEHKQIGLNVLYKSCSDILGASAALHQRDIVNGDNKPANTFFISVRDKTGTITDAKVYLADFGGARKLEDIKNFDSGVTISEYDPPGDRVWRRAARKAGNREEFGKALKARDVYQRGVVLYQLLEGNEESWEIDSHRTTKHPPAYPDAKFNEEPLREKHVPDEMIAQLKAMMDPDPKKRPDADTAKKNWDQLLFKLSPAKESEKA